MFGIKLFALLVGVIARIFMADLTGNW